jgi:hypothetical protein
VRYLFNQWSDGAGSNPRTAAPTAAASYVAVFRTEFRLSVAASPASGGSVSPPGGGYYTSGSVVSLTATPSHGFTFAGWSGDASGSAATVGVSMSAARNATANFACSYSVAPTWQGTIGSDAAAVSLTIDTGAGCPWNTSTLPSWIHVTSGSSGTGAAAIAIALDANTATAARTGEIMVGGHLVTLLQAGRPAPCNISTSIPSISVGNSGAAGTVRITTTPAGCPWTASSAASWLQVYPLSGSGDSNIEYTIYPNFGTSVRSASLAINAKSVPVSQAQGFGSYNQRFAGLMYFNFFGRLASPSELALQSGVLDAGTPRADLVNSFLQTAEFSLGGRFIAGLYVGLLNRDAEFGGWQFQRNALSTGIVNPNQLVSNFLAAAEYKLAYGEPDDAGFVRLLYRYVLLREAAPPEVDGQVGALKTLTRVQLANNFLNSNEFRNGTGPRLTAFVLYSCTLLRGPNEPERNSTIAELQSGATSRSIIARLIASAEFSEILR